MGEIAAQTGYSTVYALECDFAKDLSSLRDRRAEMICTRCSR
jgi:hypothetical protein